MNIVLNYWLIPYIKSVKLTVYQTVHHDQHQA